MSMEEKKDAGLDDVRMALRTTIVKTVMDDKRLKPVVEEVGDGARVFATHKISFKGHELFAHSEEDAEFAKAAILALNLAMAVKFASELTGAAMKKAE